MKQVMVTIQGGIVQNVISDIQDNEIELIIADIDKESTISITTMVVERRKDIPARLNETIYNDTSKWIGCAVTVTPRNFDDFNHKFSGTLKGVGISQDFKKLWLDVEDKDGHRFDVDFDQVNFDE